MLFTYDNERFFWARVEEWDLSTGKFVPVYTKNELSDQGRPVWVDPTQVSGFTCFLGGGLIIARIYSGPEIHNLSNSKKWVELRFAGLGIWRMCALSEKEGGDSFDGLRTEEALKALDLQTVLITAQKALWKAERRNDFDPASKAALAKNLAGVEALLLQQYNTLPWEDMLKRFSGWLAQKLS